jgi:amino acid transporter
VYLSAILGVTACALSNLIAQTRINSSLAKDGLFYSVFADIDAKTKVPVKGAWILAIPIAICGFVLDLTAITKVTSVCSMCLYGFINITFLCYRLRGGI